MRKRTGAFRAVPGLLLAGAVLAQAALGQQVDVDHNSLPSLGSDAAPLPAGQHGDIRGFGSVLAGLHGAAEGRVRVNASVQLVLAPGTALEMVLTEPGFGPDSNSSVGAEIVATSGGSVARMAIASANIAIPGTGLASVSPTLQVTLSASTDEDQATMRFAVTNREPDPLHVRLHLDGVCDGTNFDPVLHYAVTALAAMPPPAVPPAANPTLPPTAPPTGGKFPHPG